MGHLIPGGLMAQLLPQQQQSMGMKGLFPLIAALMRAQTGQVPAWANAAPMHDSFGMKLLDALINGKSGGSFGQWGYERPNQTAYPLEENPAHMGQYSEPPLSEHMPFPGTSQSMYDNPLFSLFLRGFGGLSGGHGGNL